MISLIVVLFGSSLMALTELENLMIKEAVTPEGKTAAKNYLMNIAKEKETAAKHHEEQAGIFGSAGKAVSEASAKKNHTKLAKDLKSEAMDYKKAAESIK